MGRSDSNKNRKSSRKEGASFKRKGFVKGKPSTKKGQEAKAPSDPNVIRLNRYVANSGVCSRREADIFISAGSVTVNGKPISEMGYKVRLTDDVRFDGRRLNPIKKEYVLLNKPKDFVTTGKDDRGRRTAMGLVAGASKSELPPVDKLDKSTTGLLLFTNDGELGKRLARPKNGLRKIYHVTLTKELRSADLKRIQEGVTVDENTVRVKEISFVDNAPKNQVGIEIYSSRNNIVKRIFEELDYTVTKLDRVVYGTLTKKDLPRGHWRYLTEQEVINLGMVK